MAEPNGHKDDDSRPTSSSPDEHAVPKINGVIPTLETPDGQWSPDDGNDANGTTHHAPGVDDTVRRSFDDQQQRRGPQPLMRMQNRSTPSLPSHQSDQLGRASHPPLPGQDPTSELNLAAMHINDPIPRPGTSNSYRQGEHPRGPPPGYFPGPSQPPRPWMGHPSRHGSLPHQWGIPPGPRPPPAHDPNAPYPNRMSGHEGDGQIDNSDKVSIRSVDSRRPPGPPMGGPPPNGYMHRPPPPHGPGGYPGYPPPQGFHPPPGWHPPPPMQNSFYAAASDVLGLGPPPGTATPAPLPQSVSAPYPPPPPPGGPQLAPPEAGGLAPYPPGQGLMRGPSNASSLRPPDSRPGLQRAPTTVSDVSPLNSRKTKAIDVNAPPYTKEYVEEYRARIKADPDPEAHFAYAKYLIEAAKKIGSDSADQRAVKKYRDSLLVESLKVIRRLATQGETYSEAQFFLANCHGTGMLGLQVDHERAYHLYLQAAKQDHPAASYRVAVCNDIGAGTKKDPLRAFTFYRKAASLGDTAAMYKLGTILLRGGLGQPPNCREAVQWLKRAAEQADDENPHALYTLAGLHERYDNEGGVLYDEAYALELYIRAGHLGHVPSQLKLGSCYESGSLTCPIDPRRSIAWYSKAAERGDPEAELCLSGWYLTGCEGILKQSDSEAYLWARKAANKGWPRAEYAVGYYAEVGIGVQQDMELARRWYMRAAAQGNKRAMARLTELKRMGNRRPNAARPTRQQATDEGCVLM